MASPSNRPNERLRQARLLRGWSQQDVADRIGASNYYLSRWERGTTTPSPYYRQKLCALFEKNAAELGLLSEAEEAEEGAHPLSGPEEVSSPARQPAEAARRVDDPLIPVMATGSARLVGRAALLDTLRQRLCASPLPTNIAIHGLPGVGKTALAVALAYDPVLREHFCDGLLWAGLGPRPEIASILSHWGALLAVTPADSSVSTPDSETWALALRRAIGNRRMLIFVDDAWQLDDLLAFKVGGPACAYVATTRFPHIAMQFALDNAIALEELGEDESMLLLNQIAPSLASEEPEALTHLVRAVGGLPLALTLMGHYLLTQTHNRQPRRTRSAIERLRDVETRLKLSVPQALLGNSSALNAQRPVSLQAVIAVSDQQLSEESRAALRALSIFPPRPNTFSEEAALAVAATTEETLDGLSDAGLLESRQGRYTLHQTISDYARSTLTDDSPYQRLVAYFVAYVEAQQRNYDALDQEMANILTAFDAACTRKQSASLARGIKHYYPFLDARGLYELAVSQFRQAERVCREVADNASLEQILYLIGKIAEERGDYDRAQSCYAEALQLARASGVQQKIGILLVAQIALSIRSGRYELLEEKFAEAQNIARQTDNRDILIRILGSKGALANEKGQFAEGERYLLEALELIRQTGQEESLFQVLNNLCSSTAEQGKYEQAEAYQLEVVELVRRQGHRERLCGSLCNLGALYSYQKKYELAKHALEEALSLAYQLNHDEWKSIILTNQAEIADAEGRSTDVIALLREALALARQLGLGWILTAILLALGDAFLKQGDIAAAAPCFDEVQDWARARQSHALLADALYGMARLEAQQGCYMQAVSSGQEALAFYEACNHRKVAEVRAWLASLAGRQ